MSHLRALHVLALAVIARVAASGNGAAVDISGYSGEAQLILDASVTEAADNTLAVKVQDSADGTTGWADVTGAAFATVTNAAASFQRINLNIDKCKKYLRVVDTAAGTSPKCTRAVHLLAKKDRV